MKPSNRVAGGCARSDCHQMQATVQVAGSVTRESPIAGVIGLHVLRVFAACRWLHVAILGE